MGDNGIFYLNLVKSSGVAGLYARAYNLVQPKNMIF